MSRSLTNLPASLFSQHMYGFDISVQTTVTVDACDVDFDVVIRIYDENLQQQIDVKDEGGCPNSQGGHTRLSRVLNPGSYVFVIEGFENASGSYNVSMSCEDVVVRGPVGCGQQLSGTTLDTNVSNIGWSSADVRCTPF